MELLAIIIWLGVLGIAVTIAVNAKPWADKLFPLEPMPEPAIRHCQSMVDVVRIFVQEVNGTTDEQK